MPQPQDEIVDNEWKENLREAQRLRHEIIQDRREWVEDLSDDQRQGLEFLNDGSLEYSDDTKRAYDNLVVIHVR
jgi:hypothetical protein